MYHPPHSSFPQTITPTQKPIIHKMIIFICLLLATASASGCAQTSTNCFQGQGTSSQFIGGAVGGNNVILNLPTPASTVTYTFPDAGANANVLLSQGNLNIGGSITQQYSGNVATNIINSGSTGSAAIYYQGSTAHGQCLTYQAGDGKFWINNQATGPNSVVVFQVAGTNVMQVASDGLHFFSSGSDSVITSASQTSNRQFTLPTVPSDSKFVVDHGNSTLFKDSGNAYALFDSSNGRVVIGGTSPEKAASLTVINGAQIDTLTVGTSLRLPTVGGIPSSFTYYESGYVLTTTMTNLYCSGCTSTFHISCTRIGNIVTLGLDSITGTTAAGWNGIGIVNDPIPARFRPALTMHFPYIVKFNGVPNTGPGCLDVSASGDVIFWETLCGKAFLASAAVGWWYTTITYPV